MARVEECLTYRKIDESIYIMAKIKLIVAANFMEFENKSLKFDTDEVKTTLLDFKFRSLSS